MSDTPRVDAVCGWAVGYRGPMASGDLIKNVDAPFVHSTFARQLERELNVANNWVEHHQNHCDDLIKENARLRMELDSSCNAEELRQVREENSRLHVELDAFYNSEQLRMLRAEVATLRADRDRLDSGTIVLPVRGEPVIFVGTDLRSAIDAGIRKAQS